MTSQLAALVGELLCKIGWHRMVTINPQRRDCSRCSRMQRLRFYSNRTQDWVAEHQEGGRDPSTQRQDSNG